VQLLREGIRVELAISEGDEHKVFWEASGEYASEVVVNTEPRVWDWACSGVGVPT
jgi:hypothetical protein